MLVLLTEKCQAACNHCFESATMKDSDMSEEVFKNLLQFISNTKPKVVTLSGGEMTLHKNYFQFVKELVVLFPQTMFILETNGLSLLDNEQIRKDTISLLNYPNVPFMQLRSVDGHYPTHRRILDNADSLSKIHHKISVITEPLAAQVYPLGRGKKLTKPEEYKNLSLCFKLFINGKQFQYSTFSQFINQHHQTGTFCTPLIDVRGDIHAGETKYCSVIGNIKDSQETLANNIRNFKPCKGCGVVNSREKLQAKMKTQC